MRLARRGDPSVHRSLEKLAVEGRDQVGAHEDPAGAAKQEGGESKVVVPGEDGDAVADGLDLCGDHGQVAFAFLERDDGRDAGEPLQDADVERDAGPPRVVVGHDRDGGRVGDTGEVLANAVGAGFDVVGRQHENSVRPGLRGMADRRLYLPRPGCQGADQDRDAPGRLVDRDFDDTLPLRRRQADEFAAAADDEQPGDAGADLELDQLAERGFVERVGAREGGDECRVDAVWRVCHGSVLGRGQFDPLRDSTDQSSDKAR